MTNNTTDNPPERGTERSSVEAATADADEQRGETGEETHRQRPHYRPPRHERFDWRGWLLVGVVVVSFLVIPGAILYLPHAQDLIAQLGIGWRQAYLTLPMIPAILLGSVAIWVAVSSRQSDE